MIRTAMGVTVAFTLHLLGAEPPDRNAGPRAD